MSLDGATAIVTAAGAGAGNVIARALAHKGARVVACDISSDELSTLTDMGNGIVSLAGDASEETTANEAVELAGGRVDILVNNVGIAGPTAACEDISLEDWNETLCVNLTSHFLFARSVIPGMKTKGSGLIVNISSGSAKVGLPLRLPYVVSKGAVLSLTQTLARELGPSGIRVNAILPGAIRGDRIRRVIENKAEALGQTAEDYERHLLKYISLRSRVYISLHFCQRFMTSYRANL